MPLIVGTNSIKDTGYDVANSCRFNDDDGAYMHKTPSSGGSQTTFTFSTWLKQGDLGSSSVLFASGEADGDPNFAIYMDSAQQINILYYESSTLLHLESNALYRDPSAWMHVCVAIDTTQSTNTNRAKLYVNGTQVTSLATSTYCDQNVDISINTDAYRMSVGAGVGDGDDLDGYLAETVFIDGSALAATSFGEFDEDSPTIWKPIDVSGLTFGTNGFYLDFEASDNLGNDANGGTDLTEVNLAATDQTTDTPTNNFATMNPLHIATSYAPAFSQGNLQIVTPVFGAGVCVSTIGATSGKWYAEVYVAAYASLDRTCVAITGDANGTITANTNIGSLTTSLDVGYFGPDGDKFVGNSETSYGDSYAVDDIVGIALNIDDNEVKFYKNGTVQASGSAISFTANSTYHFALGDVSNGGGNTLVINFGQEGSFAGETTAQGNADGNGYGDFYYSPPSGFYALCTKNLAEYG